MSKQNNSKKKQICKIILGIIILTAVYFAGFFTAKSYWFNKHFYKLPKLSDDKQLNIKSLESYDRAYFEQAQTQTKLNLSGADRYEHYHKYYKKVVSRIKKYDFGDDTVKKVIVSYIDKYENRKTEFKNILFPHLDEPYYYGSMLGCLYPKAMLEFDRQELLTYKMILQYMYTPLSEQVIEQIFAE